MKVFYDKDCDIKLVKGKRVASVGTGASAIQYVPQIARDVSQLYVVQRTPPWVMPHSARRITRLERRIFKRFPAAARRSPVSVPATRSPGSGVTKGSAASRRFGDPG